MRVQDALVGAGVALAEQRRIPDAVIRRGMRRVVAARLAREAKRPESDRTAFWEEAWSGPIAVATDAANAQHYEVPAAFFELVLGPHRKYSAGYWPVGVSDVAAAEEAMLALTAERAALRNGHAILDLGCGWGSFTLWAAQRYPASSITAVSNSTSQRRFILDTAAARGLDNITVVTDDINDFDPDRRFDRIVSVEMLEHVRNHRALFRRMRRWIVDDGAAFIHVFAHHSHAYPYETEGPASWMAETFFSGGVMPSLHLLPTAAAGVFNAADTWWIDGTHYARTLEAWLQALDDKSAAVGTVLRSTYGTETDLWIQRWRMFFMACSTMFAHGDGRQWGVVHHRFDPA